MLFKLSLRNMRRSVKDYAIYFVTLVLAVIIFYAFNSITDQHLMKKINESDYVNILELMDMLMNLFSIVVALVLGFLIIYANQLLVNRRKSEFGIYFTLGMRPGQVSRILLYETFLVGVISLAVGLVVGVLVSQLLSFATAALFGIPMNDYQFDFSPKACLFTLLSFMVVFVIVAIFNVISIHRCRLIDLINASKKSQKITIRNPWLCLILFICSIAIIAAAYAIFTDTGFFNMEDNRDFLVSAALMLLGTLLLFFSLAGFMVAVVTRSKAFYLRKLRPFTFRQVASKINTSFASMWIVCLLLFLSLTVFSTGINLVAVFSGDIERCNPFDASIVYNRGDEPADTYSQGSDGFLRYLEGETPEWATDVDEAAQMDIYELEGLTYKRYLDENGIVLDDPTAQSTVSFEDSYVEIVSIDDVNASLSLIGRDPIDVSDDEYVIFNNVPLYDQIARDAAVEGAKLATPIGALKANTEVQDFQLNDFTVLGTIMTLAVPDSVIVSLGDQAPIMTLVNLEFSQGADVSGFLKTMDKVPDPPVSFVVAREEMVQQSMGLRVLLTYLAVYIGLVMLVATAAVLAIQLLSLAIDSLSRYRMLVRLGCDPSMLKGSLFAQTAIFFLAPLVPAICHSVCALSVINGEIATLTRIGTETVVIAMLCLLVIYGGYLLITYLSSRGLIKEAWARP